MPALLHLLALPSLLLTLLVVVVGAQEMLEASSSSTTTPLVIFPTISSSSSNQTAAQSAMMPEAKRAPEPMWSPSPQDLTPMMMHHQHHQHQPPPAPPTMPAAPMPQTLLYPAAVAHSPPQQLPMPQPQPQTQPQPQQPFVPANYYLPAEEYVGSQYGPPISSSNEYRSEHYGSYPPFEQPPPSYPVQAQPQQQQIDTSLMPTAKHFVLVGFIGLLLLFAIIQNSIAAAKRKDALVEVLSNRKKRDIVALTSLERMTPEVESALNEDARIRCIQRTLCYENRKLHEDLGVIGKLLAKYLTRNVQSSLKDWSPGWDRLVEDAASAGLRGEDCDVLYRDCSSEFATETEITEEDEE